MAADWLPEINDSIVSSATHYKRQNGWTLCLKRMLLPPIQQSPFPTDVKTTPWLKGDWSLNGTWPFVNSANWNDFSRFS